MHLLAMADGVPFDAYLIDGALLGLFMISACSVVVLVCHPVSPIARVIVRPWHRRAVIGVLMGLTAVGLIYSPLGARSGAHMNPGVTATFYVLGRVRAMDAVFYVIAQFVGGTLGVAIASLLWRSLVSHQQVRYAVTLPGRRGVRIAWIAEFVIAFLLMSMVLWSTNNAITAPYTGVFAGCMVAVFILLEAPLSGMSMNPARSFASAIFGGERRALWIYFTAPPLAMVTAAGLYVSIRGIDHVYCCKLHHGDGPCQFECRVDQMPGAVQRPTHANPQPEIGIKRPR